MIYCSYSQKDRPMVQRVCQSLTERGIQLFVDSKQLAGGDYAQELTKQIESAEAILFFYSENTENSTWVKHEIEFALSKRKSIVPVLLSESEESSWLHFNLGSYYWIKLDSENINSIADRIIKSLKFSWEDNSGILPETSVEVKDDDLTNAPLSNQSNDDVPLTKKKKHIGCGCGIIVILGLIGLFLYYALSYFDSLNPSYTTSSPSYDSISYSNIEHGHKDSLDLKQREAELKNRVDEREVLERRIAEMEHEKRNHQEFESDSSSNTPIEIPCDTSPNSCTSFTWVYLLGSFFIGCGLMFLLLRVKKSRKDNIKLSSDIASKISIDGDLQKEVEPREVYTTHLEKGEYLIDFEDKKDENRHKTFNHEVTSKDCKLVFANFLEESSQNGKTIKCFIAGSKTLQQERDALRAVTCVMYNKWDSKNFRILSYTFEDFKKEHTLIPPQELYNKFIEEEADWALFIIDGKVGGITVNEYRVAMDSFKKNGKPKILALAKVGSENNEKVAEIRDEINKEHQYWTDYTDIVSLKYIFESTLNWDLIRMFQDK